MKTLLPLAALATMSVLAAGPAAAAPVLIDFEQAANIVQVNQTYAGLGVEFFDFVTATGASRYAYSPGGHGVINVPGGFDSFDFSLGTLAPATFNVWSGLDGTGSLLGSAVFAANGGSFAAASVPFSGLGHSVTLAAVPAYTGIDNVALGAPPVPEPAHWAMLVAGLLLGGLIKRRRR